MRNKIPQVDKAFLHQLSSQFNFFNDGPGRKATKAHLAAEMGTSTRMIERGVFELRKDGMAILADGEGYWLAKRPEEFHPVLKSLRHRLREIYGTYRSLEHARERLLQSATTEPSGQKRIF